MGLHVHHWIPRRVGGLDTPANTALITEESHRALHRNDQYHNILSRIGALKRVLMMDWVENLRQFKNWHPKAIEMYKTAWLVENYQHIQAQIEYLEGFLPA